MKLLVIDIEEEVWKRIHETRLRTFCFTRPDSGRHYNVIDQINKKRGNGMTLAQE